MIEKRKYKRASLPVSEATPEEIISGNLDKEIERRMVSVIKTEAPILESLLFKRVILSFSLSKVGSRIHFVFKEISYRLAFERTLEEGEWVYHNGKEENFFRPSPDSEDRYSYQIPPSEAAKCIEYILSNTDKSMLRKDLSEQFKRELGYERMGTQVDALFKAALKTAIIKKSGGRYRAF